MEKQSITIKIGDRHYPFRIKPEEEELIRVAEKRIKQVIEYYRTKYPSRDLLDTFSMALFQFAISTVTFEQNTELNGLINELKALDSQLSEYLDEK